MGLDMFLYKFKKVRREEAELVEGMSIENIERLGYTVFWTYGKDISPLEEVLPWIRPVRVRAELLDIDKLKRDYMVPGDASEAGYSLSDEYETFRFVNRCGTDTDRYSISVPKHLIADEYTYIKDVDVYIAKYDEIAYWRNNHELQELFYEAAETDGVRIQNTGYYPLTETMWEALNNVDSETFENVVNLPDDDEVIVYHEWW